MELSALKNSILHIGRTLPVGMEVHFDRVEGDHRVRMVLVEPSGASTEYAFTSSYPLPNFPINALMRETHLAMALRSLLDAIDLHTDCMDGHLERSGIEGQIDHAESLLRQLEEEE